MCAIKFEFKYPRRIPKKFSRAAFRINGINRINSDINRAMLTALTTL